MIENPIEKPYWADTKIWRNWRREVRRGHSKPTLNAFKAYSDSWGTKPQQKLEMSTSEREDIVMKSKVAYRASEMGRKAFGQLVARIESGLSSPLFHVNGNVVEVRIKVPGVVKELRKR